MKQVEIDQILKAGEIHKKVVAYARELVKPGMKLLEIAEAIDSKILELGGKPAFPVNLSVDSQAAHCTPAWNSEEEARGLLKVDIGIHVEGFVADGAFTLDLSSGEESLQNRKLIEAAEAGLKSGIDKFDAGVSLGEVGKVIGSEIEKFGFSPVRNLTGHQIEQYDLHAGLQVPNYDSGEETKIVEGLYAMEPFSTNGEGRVKNGPLSGIYKIENDGNVRDDFAREVLSFLYEEYDNLPFCSRWIYKKFGARGLLALRQIENAGILKQYHQLVEVSGGKVAQAEHTILLHEGKKIVTTRD